MDLCTTHILGIFLARHHKLFFKMKNFRHQRLSTLLIRVFILFSSGVIFLYFSSASLLNNHQSEENRGFVFPAFTVMQFAVGLACPTQIPNRSVATNWGVLSNLPLPSKINQLYPYVGKGRQLTHDFLYESLIAVWNWHNSNGKECVLKTICQVSSIKFSENRELISNVLRLLFSPSSLKYPVAKTHFMIAEQIGSTPNRSCTELYPLCSHSIIDLIVN